MHGWTWRVHMQVRTPIQSLLSVRSGERPFPVSVVGTLIVLSFTVGLEIALAATNLRLRTPDTERLSFVTVVDRAAKADRLVPRHGAPQNRRMPRQDYRAPNADPKLTVGC